MHRVQIPELRDAFASIVSFAEITSKRTDVVYVQGWSDAEDGEVLFDGMVATPVCFAALQNVLDEHHKMEPDYILVGVYRQGKPVVTVADVLHLGRLVEGIEPNSGCLIVDYLIIGEDGQWASVLDFSGLRDKVWCPGCGHVIYDLGDAPVAGKFDAENYEADAQFLLEYHAKDCGEVEGVRQALASYKEKKIEIEGPKSEDAENAARRIIEYVEAVR